MHSAPTIRRSHVDTLARYQKTFNNNNNKLYCLTGKFITDVISMMTEWE